MDASPHPVHITVAQAADLARVSARTIRRWIAAGRLLSIRFGNARLVDRGDLARLLTAHTGVSAQTADHAGQVAMSKSVFVELTQRLHAQAAELAVLRLERDQLAEQLQTLERGGSRVHTEPRLQGEPVGSAY